MTTRAPGAPLPRRALAAVALLAFAVVAVWAASRLWSTDVPGDLPQPAVDPAETFGETALDEAKSFETFLRVSAVLSQVALLATLGLYAFRGARFVRESAAGPIGTGFLLGMLGLAIAWLVQLPFLIADTWWLRHHDVIEAGYVEAIVGDLAGLAETFLFVCFALLIAMGLARFVRERWWLPAGVAFVALFAGLNYVAPYLLFGLDPATPALKRQAVELARAEGLDDDVPVEIMPVREELSQPNAFAFGLGATRRIVIFDTLAEDFPAREVRATLAHEVAHHARDHIAKGIGWFAVVILPTALIVAFATRRRGGMAVPEAVPLALFVVVALNVVTMPLQNAASRRYEAEADWTALQATRDPKAVEDLWRDFTLRALADPDPPGWWHVLYDTHPSGVERVEMARAWAQLNGHR
ncbi:MAG TPA: M48 family metalloprotease [Capillimicrobium sp.]|nr:M48 family metalloprotease [Capillimicrobium sp.]